jgi:hypothetical protein
MSNDCPLHPFPLEDSATSSHEAVPDEASPLDLVQAPVPWNQ